MATSSLPLPDIVETGRPFTRGDLRAAGHAADPRGRRRGGNEFASCQHRMSSRRRAYFGASTCEAMIIRCASDVPW